MVQKQVHLVLLDEEITILQISITVNYMQEKKSQLQLILLKMKYLMKV